jgi:uncharacterized protein YndB with AHSA1/START domain
MAHAEARVTIEKPAREVFDFLADGVNNKRWRSGVVEISRVSGDAVSGEGVGARYRQTLRGPGGRSIDGDYRITACDRPTRLAFEVVAGPARPTGTFLLRPEGPSSVSVTFTLDLQPRGLMRAMAPMVNRQMQKEVAALTELKRVMEGSS